MENLNYANTVIKDGFWKRYAELARNVTVHSVYDRFAETGRFKAMRCDWKIDEPQGPQLFWDSDIAKWLEGAAYLIETKGEPELEKIIEETIDLIESNQNKNGYFNSHFLTCRPDSIFTNRKAHELYTTGHLIEAAIAYHNATGKDRFLKLMQKNVDYIYRVFIEEKSARFITPGHEEIELALIKLYKHTGDEKALELARFFIDQRGNNELEEKTPYDQSDTPLRELNEAVGHAVRAGYLYTAMAMLSGIDKDLELKKACDRVFADMIYTKMCITGGIGSNCKGEGFSYAYDLPNINSYNESCAAIALAMFAGEMQQLEVNSLYGDIIERVYYNNFLSSISLSGDKFFYTNPLELIQKKYQRVGEYQPPSERVKVFDCSCCPPNILRMLATLSRYMYTLDGDTIYCNQFADSETNLTIHGKDAKIIQKTAYPLDGKITFTYYGEPTTLCVRIPDWCVEFAGKSENGYAKFKISDGDTVSLELPMELHFMEANPNLQDDSGRYAVMRGPFVYCMESIDNGENLRDISLIENGNVEIKMESEFPAPVIYIDAERRADMNCLYQIKAANTIPFTARLIPYFCFSNRTVTDMIVWTMVK